MYQFKKAIRENVNLIICLAGGTGSGKTLSAMKLAKGMSGGKRFAVLDTENGRASLYADSYDFDVCELHAPFTPRSYAEAIEAADKAGYPVIVVDSASHEHAGDGGLLDMHEDELERLAGDDYAKRERVKMAAWIRPKSDHKRFVQRLLQVKAHLILAFRAESKIEVIKKDGKMEVVPKKSLVGLDGWVPIAEKNLPFEATASFLLIADRPGVPHPIKLPEMLKPMFPLDQPISEESGKRVAAWAAGGKAPAPVSKPNGKVDTAPILKAFKALAIGQESLETFLGSAESGPKPMADWTAADIETLREIYRDKIAESKQEVVL